MINKGEWVQISSVILQVGERASQVPQDTAETPLVMWVKGYLLDDEAQIGDEVSIETVTGRVTKGTLVQVHPVYTHSFGEYVPEITHIHRMLEGELADD